MPQTDDKKIIFSMVGVSKIIPPSRQILKDIYLSFFYGAVSYTHLTLPTSDLPLVLLWSQDRHHRLERSR